MVVGVAGFHFVLQHVLGVDSHAKVVCTDLALVAASATATIMCARTALRTGDRHNRIAWFALAAGLAAWWVASVMWSVRELLLGDLAPAPSWFDAPFFLLAPSFALALVYYRRRPSRALQLRQIADLGIVTATIAIVGTLVLAGPIRQSGTTPYVIVAIGYPGFYLAVVLVALGSLARGSWGSHRVVLGILIWAHLAFATVDLLYGAKVLTEIYQTDLEDTLWLAGMLSMCWAATEERALLEVREDTVVKTSPSWNAVLGAIAIIALTALSADTIGRLDGVEWTIIGVATIVAVGFVGLRMWTSERFEAAYLDAVLDSEEKQRELSEERTKLSRLRAVGSLAGGTAHELNNLLQAIAGNLALLRRRAGRGEDIQTYLASIEKALVMLGTEVGELRKLSPADSVHGMVLILPCGDRDGSLCAVLAEAGFSPAILPDVDSVVRAAKGDGVHAIVASSKQAAALTERGLTIPIIRRDAENVVDTVVAVVAAIDRRR
jgi:signal transduction histidine kinase